MNVPTIDKLQDLWVYHRVNQYYDENRPAPDHSLFIAEFKTAIEQIKADAWDEGADTAWKATGEGHNGEYAGPFGTHDGTVPFLRANKDITNPYRKEQDDEQG